MTSDQLLPRSPPVSCHTLLPLALSPQLCVLSARESQSHYQTCKDLDVAEHALGNLVWAVTKSVFELVAKGTVREVLLWAHPHKRVSMVYLSHYRYILSKRTGRTGEERFYRLARTLMLIQWIVAVVFGKALLKSDLLDDDQLSIGVYIQVLARFSAGMVQRYATAAEYTSATRDEKRHCTESKFWVRLLCFGCVPCERLIPLAARVCARQHAGAGGCGWDMASMKRAAKLAGDELLSVARSLDIEIKGDLYSNLKALYKLNEPTDEQSKLLRLAVRCGARMAGI